MTDDAHENVRTASCSCGALTARARGEPVQINICSCLACQKRSGAAFTYTAFFPDAAVEIAGEHKNWRRATHSGGTHDAFFCPRCGATVFTRLSAVPGMTGIAVGCFADAAFAKPHAHYWSASRHQWIAAPDGVAALAAQ